MLSCESENKRMKKISIIIPAYNASNYLREAIDSALAQTYENKEIIVINDGSKDDDATEKIALSYGKKIKYYKKENGGCASALNSGIKVMTGDYFSWLSHDDLYKPEKLEALMALIEFYKLNPNETILGSNDLILNAQGKLSKNIFNNSTGVLSSELAFDETLNIKTINGCGLLIPKGAFEKVGLFREDYKHLLDRELWMRLALYGYSFCFANEPLVISRVHNNQVTVSAQRLLYEEETKLINEYIPMTLKIQNKKMLCSLCFFAYKRKHYDVGKTIKTKLAEHDWLSLSVRTKICKYYFRGNFRRVLGKAYKKLIRR